MYTISWGWEWVQVGRYVTSIIKVVVLQGVNIEGLYEDTVGRHLYRLKRCTGGALYYEL